jgi:hypothetical protein
MASRVYKPLPKKSGHAHREHWSKKGRRKKPKPDYAQQVRQAKREKKALIQHMRRISSHDFQIKCLVILHHSMKSASRMLQSEFINVGKPLFLQRNKQAL